LSLLRVNSHSSAVGRRPTVTAIITAYDEAPVLIATVNALITQIEPPDQILIAEVGAMAEASETNSRLRWLRMPHRGKASTLNAALTCVETALFITVDADTILLPDAIGAMRDAFSPDQKLVAATGVLTPVCNNTSSGRLLEWFQSYEYVRNFLSRYAWMQMNGQLLISGALAGFRTDAVLSVGGFDPDCLVEDYELIHRLRRYGYDLRLDWHTSVLGGALGRTTAPSTVGRFLRQRRRWFGGFLQTHNWYRDMVGATRYGDLGIWMLPVKATDTMQPIYGLSAFLLLIWYIVTGRIDLLLPVGGLIIGKIVIDLGVHSWSIFLYRRWVGGQTKVKFSLAVLTATVEPFSFQLFRHLGASWGWFAFFTGWRDW
jgi:cellulose synthase/poly-beta-1,6-N-acetylglucosamine synthase-like glycosyltransferase